MPTVEASGTLLATAAEQTLATVSSNRNLLLVVDLTLMQAGDTVILKVYRKVLTTGALVLYARQSYVDAQTDPVAISIPFPSPFQASATLQQTVGGFRNFPWSLESL